MAETTEIGKPHSSGSGITTLVSPLMEVLHGRSIQLHDRPGFGHPLTAYALLHQRLARGIDAAIRAVTLEEERRKKEGYDQSTIGSPILALDVVQDVIFRAAELFEFYESDILHYLGVHKIGKHKEIRQAYMSVIRQVKRTWSLICNRCKHNHAFLIPVEGYYESGDWVSGFSLFQRSGNDIRVEQDIHGAAEAFSYNWSLRSLLSDVIRADLASADLVSKLEDDAVSPKLNTLGLILPYANGFESVSRRSTVAMPREGRDITSGIKIFNDEITIGNVEKMSPGSGLFRMTVIINLLGSDLSVRLPYQGSAVRVTHNVPENGEPLGGLFRLVVRDIMVSSEPNVT